MKPPFLSASGGGSTPKEPGPQKNGPSGFNPDSVPKGGRMPKADAPGGADRGVGTIGDSKKPFKITKS